VYTTIKLYRIKTNTARVLKNLEVLVHLQKISTEGKIKMAPG